MHPTGTNSIALVRTYLRLLLAADGKRVCAFLAIACLTGLVGGVGILMLIPLLDVVGLGGSHGGLASGVSRFFAASLGALGASPSLGTVLVLFVLLVAGYALLNRWLQITRSRLELRFTKLLQDRLFAAITETRWSRFVQLRNSDFTHALSSNLDRVSAGTFYFLRLLSTGLLALIHLVIAVSLSPLMALFCLGCFVLLWRVLASQNREATRTGEQVTAVTESFYAQITDHLNGMKEVKSIGAEQRHVEAFERTTAALVKTRLGYTQVGENTKLIYTVGSASVLAGLLFVALGRLQVPLAELTVLIFIFSRLIPRVRDMHVGYQQVLNMLPALASALELQESCEEDREPASASGEPEFEEAIEFRGVSYRYASDAADWALREIDMKIPARSTTALVGPSGAGKTTLADVLLGLLTPDAGEVLIDGERLDGGRIAAWRKKTGYVPQSTFLLNDTIRRNLLWGMPAASEADLEESLKLAAAAEFVHALPRAMDTVVGDSGIRLSGGERQRIALARALLRRPALLILDEATSSLDTEHQQRIQSAIDDLKGELTIVIIAHRFSTVQHADRIVVLDGGRIVEQGDFRDLACRAGGRFRAMMEAEGFQVETTLPVGKME